jgi:hypothetical protein
VSEVITALNDPERSIIGNPREGGYRITIAYEDPSLIKPMVMNLATIGIVPTTTISYNSWGIFKRGRINIDSKSGQRRLLQIVDDERLIPDRRRLLADLTAARGPVNDKVRDLIYEATDKGEQPSQIAKRLNDLDVMSGRGGMGWTGQKIRKILKSRADESELAA